MRVVAFLLILIITGHHNLQSQNLNELRRLYSEAKYDVLINSNVLSVERYTSDQVKIIADAHLNRSRALYHGYELLLEASENLVLKHPNYTENKSAVFIDLLSEIRYRKSHVTRSKAEQLQIQRLLNTNRKWYRNGLNPNIAFLKSEFARINCASINNAYRNSCKLLEISSSLSDNNFVTYKEIVRLQSLIVYKSTSNYLDKLTIPNISDEDFAFEIISTIDAIYTYYYSDLRSAQFLYQKINDLEASTAAVKARDWQFFKSNTAGSNRDNRIRLVYSIGTQIAACTDESMRKINTLDHRMGMVPLSYAIILINTCVSASELKEKYHHHFRQFDPTRLEESLTVARVLSIFGEYDEALEILNRHLTRSIIFDIRRSQPMAMSISAYLRYKNGSVENLNDTRRQLSILSENFASFTPIFLMVQLSTLSNLSILGTNPSLFID